MQSWWRGLWIALALALGLGGCGGSIWDDRPPIADVEGEWTVTETITEDDCDPQRADRSYQIDIVQNGTSIKVYSTLEKPDPNPLTGSIDGDTLTWTGTFEEGDETVTITDLSLTVLGDRFEGTSVWTRTQGTGSCSGTSDVTGERST